MAVALRIGQANDAGTIAAVATHVFLDTYAAAGVRPDLAREVFELCSERAFAAALAEPDRRFVLATTEAGVVGFAELVLRDQPADVEGVSGAELVRLYVQPESRARGVGRALVEHSGRLAMAASLRSLWLAVWELNERAIGFYRRLGFKDTGASRYTYEDQVYGTRIFAKELVDVGGNDRIRMNIEPAREEHVTAATACFAAAFRDDPLINHFFADHSTGWAAAETFFRLLLQARLASSMPALVALHDGKVVGGAMGYDTREVDWPAPIAALWNALEASSPAVARRFDAYGAVSEKHIPEIPHYYLGVIGVAPVLRGTGLGSRLLRAFCRLSDDDPSSAGVYLETGHPANVEFYSRHGFEVRGNGQLEGGVDLWCMFRPGGAGGP